MLDGVGRSVAIRSAIPLAPSSPAPQSKPTHPPIPVPMDACNPSPTLQLYRTAKEAKPPIPALASPHPAPSSSPPGSVELPGTAPAMRGHHTKSSLGPSLRAERAVGLR